MTPEEARNYHAATLQQEAVALELAESKLEVALARIVQLENDQKCVANEEVALLKKQVAAAEAALISEKQRADQLGINCRWLIEKVDRINRALCPNESGTWQQRAEKAVEAAEKSPH